MSLYNNIAESLSGNGLLGSIRSGIGASLNGLASSATQALGGGKLASTVVGMGQSMAVNAGMNAVNKYVPIQAQRALNVGAGAVGDLMKGDWDGAGLRVLGSGLLNELLPGFGGGAASQAAFLGTPTPLLGGISPAEAKSIYAQVRGERRAKKNLWLLEVTSRLAGGALNMPDRFNLFATEVEYAPYIIAGDKTRVGGAVVDCAQGSEPVDMRLTTMDDESGSLKRWFEAHHAAVAARDGTLGVPDEYAIRIRVVHSFITPGSNRGGYESVGLFRPVNLDLSLSRREDGLQELQMSFSQLDTFMRP
jgi:hypothetical protein